MRLTPLDTILTRVQTRIAAVAPRRAPISQSLGAVLAEDVRAAECPPRPIALRDGFAVAAGEIADAGPYAPLPLSLTILFSSGVSSVFSARLSAA